jgi:hypothetical protein
LPGDSSILVETRTSADKSTWTIWESVSDGVISSTTQQYIQVRATLNASTDQSSTPIIYSINIQYEGDTEDPANPSVFTGSSQSVSGSTLTTGGTYPYTNPYFTWTGASDTASSLAGYYVYFGTNSSADPESLGAPDGNQLCKINWNHYLIIKTKDTAGNISDAVTLFIYAYNGVSPPQETLYIFVKFYRYCKPSFY